jgi:hypothetical protein
MSSSIGLAITVIIVTLVLLGIGYGFRYFVKKLKERTQERKTLRYVIIFFSWLVAIIIVFWVAVYLTPFLGFRIFYNPSDISECFSPLRTDSMRKTCFERHIREADDISICNSIEDVQLRKNVNRDDEYFVSRDHCILTLVGYYYVDTSKLKHRDWCYELSAYSKMADGRSLVEGCLSKFE